MATNQELPNDNVIRLPPDLARGPRVVLTHVHAEEHYAVVLDGALYLVQVECDGRTTLTNDRLDWDPSFELEERAIRLALGFRASRPALVPRHLVCGCGGCPPGGAS